MTKKQDVCYHPLIYELEKEAKRMYHEQSQEYEVAMINESYLVSTSKDQNHLTKIVDGIDSENNTIDSNNDNSDDEITVVCSYNKEILAKISQDTVEQIYYIKNHNNKKYDVESNFHSNTKKTFQISSLNIETILSTTRSITSSGFLIEDEDNNDENNNIMFDSSVSPENHVHVLRKKVTFDVIEDELLFGSNYDDELVPISSSSLFDDDDSYSVLSHDIPSTTSDNIIESSSTNSISSIDDHDDTSKLIKHTNILFLDIDDVKEIGILLGVFDEKEVYNDETGYLGTSSFVREVFHLFSTFLCCCSNATTTEKEFDTKSNLNDKYNIQNNNNNTSSSITADEVNSDLYITEEEEEEEVLWCDKDGNAN